MVVVGPVSRLLQINKRRCHIFDSRSFEAVQQRTQMLVAASFAPSNPGAGLLHIAVPKCTSEFEPLLRAAFRDEMLSGFPAELMEEGVVRRRYGATEPDRTWSPFAACFCEVASGFDQLLRINWNSLGHWLLAVCLKQFVYVVSVELLVVFGLENYEPRQATKLAFGLDLDHDVADDTSERPEVVNGPCIRPFGRIREDQRYEQRRAFR